MANQGAHCVSIIWEWPFRSVKHNIPMHILCWISFSLILTVTDINERRWWSKWYRAEFQLVKCITELHSVSSKWISYIVYELLKIEHHKSVHIRNRGRIKFNSQNEVGYHMNREAIYGHHSIRPFRWNIRAFMTNENSMQMEFKVFGVRLSQVFNI